MLRFVCISYHRLSAFKLPAAWFERVPFYHGYLEELTHYFEVHDVASIGYEGVIERNGVAHHFVKGKRGGLSFALQVNNYVRSLKPDIVLIHGFSDPVPVILLRRQIGNNAKIIMQHHAEQPFAGWRNYAFKISGKVVDAYFFASISISEDWTRKKLIGSQEKIFQVPEASSGFTVQQLAGYDPDTFLWVGRLNANKDPVSVVKAFSEYLKHYPSGKLYMIFRETKLLHEVQREIRYNNVSGSVILVGEVRHSDMRAWYEKAAFVICSSFYEGCNISVLEGMSCGCIPIVTNASSFDLHTNNGHLGLRFEAGNSKELFECFCKTRQMSIENERKRILDHFNKELSFKAIAAKIYSAVTSLTDADV